MMAKGWNFAYCLFLERRSIFPMRVLRKGCIVEGKEWNTNFCLQLLSFPSGRGCRNSLLGRFTGRHRLDGQWLSPVFRL